MSHAPPPPHPSQILPPSQVRPGLRFSSRETTLSGQIWHSRKPGEVRPICCRLRAEGESAKADAPAEPKPATLQELQQRFRDGEPVFLAELALVYHQRNQTYYVKAGQVTREAGLIREAALALLCDFPHSRVDAIGPLEIDPFRGRLIGEQSWSRKHLNKQIDRIKRMFRWGVEKAIVTPAVYHAIAAVSALGKGRSEARELLCLKVISSRLLAEPNKATVPRREFSRRWQRGLPGGMATSQHPRRIQAAVVCRIFVWFGNVSTANRDRRSGGQPRLRPGAQPATESATGLSMGDAGGRPT